jgi:Protein of unknown function (DUF2997)
VVTFDKRGGSKIEAFGFSGSACLAATKSIEDAIGAVGDRKMKSSEATPVVAEQKVTQ